MLGALAADGVAAAVSIERATDTAVFAAFLDRVLIPELVRTRPGAVVVMDDLSPHRAPVVRRKLEAAGLGLLRLPRYTPDLSPIEPMWSKLKGLLRAAAARSVEALQAALAKALARVTPGDVRDWFRHCGYVLPGSRGEKCSRPAPAQGAAWFPPAWGARAAPSSADATKEP